MGTAGERGGARPEAGPFFALAEVAKRSSDREAWLVIHDRVYDVTRFLDEVGGATAAGGKRSRPAASPAGGDVPAWPPVAPGRRLGDAPETRRAAGALERGGRCAGRSVSLAPAAAWLAERPFHQQMQGRPLGGSGGGGFLYLNSNC